MAAIPLWLMTSRRPVASPGLDDRGRGVVGRRHSQTERRLREGGGRVGTRDQRRIASRHHVGEAPFVVGQAPGRRHLDVGGSGNPGRCRGRELGVADHRECRGQRAPEDDLGGSGEPGPGDVTSSPRGRTRRRCDRGDGGRGEIGEATGVGGRPARRRHDQVSRADGTRGVASMIWFAVSASTRPGFGPTMTEAEERLLPSIMTPCRPPRAFPGRDRRDDRRGDVGVLIGRGGGRSAGSSGDRGVDRV